MFSVRFLLVSTTTGRLAVTGVMMFNVSLLFAVGDRKQVLLQKGKAAHFSGRLVYGGPVCLLALLLVSALMAPYLLLSLTFLLSVFIGLSPSLSLFLAGRLLLAG